MNNKIEISDKCLSREEILKYKAGNLSGEELRRIEKHLIDCPLCSDALEGIESLSEVELKENFNKVKGNIGRRANINFNWQILISSAAAVLIFATFSIYFLINKSQNEKLFSKYYSPYPDVILHKRSADTVDKFSLAMNMYDKNDYKKAIKIFNSIPIEAQNDSVVFYKALTLMELENYSEAQILLGKNIKNNKSNFYYESLWYSSLINIENKKYKSAEEKLNILVKSNSRDYSVKSNQLLNKLKELN